MVNVSLLCQFAFCDNQHFVWSAILALLLLSVLHISVIVMLLSKPLRYISLKYYMWQHATFTLSYDYQLYPTDIALFHQLLTRLPHHLIFCWQMCKLLSSFSVFRNISCLILQLYIYTHTKIYLCKFWCWWYFIPVW